MAVALDLELDDFSVERLRSGEMCRRGIISTGSDHLVAFPAYVKLGDVFPVPAVPIEVEIVFGLVAVADHSPSAIQWIGEIAFGPRRASERDAVFFLSHVVAAT